MSESYSDLWKREFLEQHPEIAAVHQESHVPPHRTFPSPGSSWTLAYTSSASYPVPATRGHAPNVLSRGSQGHVAAQATSSKYGDTALQSTRALVRAACELRYQLRLTQRAFAEQLGINPRTWQEWEQGRRQPTGPGRALLEQRLKQCGSPLLLHTIQEPELG